MKHYLSIAPMLDCTDRHFRYLARLITSQTLLYTEMLTIYEVLHTKNKAIFSFHPSEHPVAVQLGGGNPHLLAQCVKLYQQENIEEINLNVGCPSSRVQSGEIGACLMRKPQLVADCIAAMVAASTIPVSVKCRLGVDNEDSFENLVNFIQTVSAAGCSKFIIHARKAWLQGLSPKENRQIPPLDYDRVFRLKQEFPHLTLVLNGGISNLEQADEHLSKINGVMIGRAAYANPFMLKEADQRFYGNNEVKATEKEVLANYQVYIEQELSLGTPLTCMIRPLLGLFKNQPGARYWRQHLSCNSHKKEANISIINDALALLEKYAVGV